MLEEIDEKWSKSENLIYQDTGPVAKGRKTRKFEVTSKHSHAIVGYVRWYAPWRQYTLFASNAIFDKRCLRELADFCELKTGEQKSASREILARKKEIERRRKHYG